MHADPDRLRRHLQSLPEPGLPAALWQRVAHARRRQVARQRWLAAGGAAAVLALLVLPGRLPSALDAPDPATGLARSDAIPPRDPQATDAATRLRSLDRELQAAYRRGSGDDEIARLWQARDALLRQADGSPPPARPVRI